VIIGNIFMLLDITKIVQKNSIIIALTMSMHVVICGATVMFKKKAKTGAVMRSTGAGMKAHLESVHKLYK
jgi:hypothetical protein